MALIRLSQVENLSGVKEERKEDTEIPARPADKEVVRPLTQENVTLPAPKNETEQTATTVSIRDLMQKNRKAKEKDMEQVSLSEDASSRDLEMEDLEKVLPGLYDLFKNKPNLSSTLKRYPPRILEGCKVEFCVINELQKTWIEEHYGGTINKYLRQALRNNKVCMALTVKEIVENSSPGNTCYMPEEKAKFMAEKHPEVAALRDDLSLDIS